MTYISTLILVHLHIFLVMKKLFELSWIESQKFA